MPSYLESGYQTLRRIFIALVGGTLLLLGLAMIVLPGPAILIVPVGLAVLGLEFAWARAWLLKLRRRISASTMSRRGR